MRFGEYLKNRRAKLGMPLRTFCLAHGIDPSNWSKLERGRMTPPQHRKLEEYAGYLGLRVGTDDWYEFFDLAAAESGRIPADLTDAEIAGKLPVLFRTLRESAKHGGDDDKALLEELKAKIRTA